MIDGRVWATLVALFSALGAFLFGLDVGYIASILECPSFKRDVGHLSNWNDDQSGIDSSTLGLIVGIFSLGGVTAALPPCSSFFTDNWGRRPSITFGSGIFLAGCLIQAGAVTVKQFMAGRFIAGFSIGLLSTVVALYQSELAPPGNRGALVSLYQLMISFGVLVATGLNYMLVMKNNGWRIAIALQAIPAVALIVGTLFMPRSPRWLVQHGRREEALEVLYTLRHSDGDANDEFQTIVKDVGTAKLQGEGQWLDLCRGRLGGMVAVGVSLQLLQQFCGMNAFMYFGPIIYRQANLDPLLFQTLNAVVNFLATIPAVLLIDVYGRKSLLACGAVGMLISCLAIGSIGLVEASRHTEAPMNGTAAIVTVIMSFNFVANFAYSWGPAVWTYCAEMFPLKYRGRCMGATTTANWVGNYMIAQFTPMLLQRFGFSAFLTFAFFCVICLLLALWLPETSGVMLEDIEGLFDEKLGMSATEEVRSIKDAKAGSVEAGGNYGSAELRERAPGSVSTEAPQS